MGFFSFFKLFFGKIGRSVKGLFGLMSLSFFKYTGLFIYVIVPNWQAIQSLNFIRLVHSFAYTFARLDIVLSEGLTQMAGEPVFSTGFGTGFLLFYAGVYGFYWNYKLLRFVGERLWGEFVPNSLWMFVFAGFYMTVFALNGNFPPDGFVALKDKGVGILDQLVGVVRDFDYISWRQFLIEREVGEVNQSLVNATSNLSK